MFLKKKQMVDYGMTEQEVKTRYLLTINQRPAVSSFVTPRRDDICQYNEKSIMECMSTYTQSFRSYRFPALNDVQDVHSSSNQG